MGLLNRTIAFTLALAGFPLAGSTCVQAEDTEKLTGETIEFYNYWKDRYIVQNKYTDDV